MNRVEQVVGPVTAEQLDNFGKSGFAKSEVLLNVRCGLDWKKVDEVIQPGKRYKFVLEELEEV